MGLESSDRDGLGTTDRGHSALLVLDDGAAIGSSGLAIDAGAGLTATIDPVSGNLVLAATGGGGVTRQNVYDAQAGAVTTTKNADLNTGATFDWSLGFSDASIAWKHFDSTKTIEVGTGASGGYLNNAGVVGTGAVGSVFARSIKVETEFSSDIVVGFHEPITGRIGVQAQGSELRLRSEADQAILESGADGFDVLVQTATSTTGSSGDIKVQTGAPFGAAAPGVIELNPGPQAFPLRVELDPGGTGAPALDRGIAGFLAFMRGANFPQIIGGAPTATGSFFIDAENNRPILLNNLHTGETVIGVGGLMAENASTDIGKSAGPAGAGVPFRDLYLSGSKVEAVTSALECVAAFNIEFKPGNGNDVEIATDTATGSINVGTTGRAFHVNCEYSYWDYDSPEMNFGALGGATGSPRILLSGNTPSIRGGAPNSVAKTFTVQATDTAGASPPGMELVVRGGDNAGTSVGVGGDLLVRGGDATNAGATTTGGNVRVRPGTAAGGGTAGELAFFDGTGSARPTVAGSRGGNAALASLLTALDTLGLITDSTTP